MFDHGFTIWIVQLHEFSNQACFISWCLLWSQMIQALSTNNKRWYKLMYALTSFNQYIFESQLLLSNFSYLILCWFSPEICPSEWLTHVSLCNINYISSSTYNICNIQYLAWTYLNHKWYNSPSWVTYDIILFNQWGYCWILE